MDNRPKRGFACGTNAVDAARKNIALGTAHQFSSEEAREAGRRGAERRWSEKAKERRDTPTRDN